MSRIKTLLMGLIAAMFVAGPVVANPLHLTFAVCTGRFSAEMEHAWLMGAVDVDETQHRRAQFISLLEAVMPVGQERKVLATRIEAKMAHARILSQATFGESEPQVMWAKKRAKSGLSACETLLLDS